MAHFSAARVRLDTIAAAVPQTIEKNSDYTRISAAERDFLIKTTGVDERRIARPDQTTSDLCAAATQAIFTAQKARPEEIGLLVFVSQSADYYLPATATLLQQRLGLPKTCMAFDVSLGCSGYVYGLAIAASLLQTLFISHALVLAGDTSSITCSPEDKSTYPLFGDAGTATLLVRDEQASPWHGNFLTDGAGAQAIMIHDGGNRHKLSPASFDMQTISPGIRRNNLSLILDGQEIFAFSLREVPPSLQQLLATTGTPLEQVDYLVMHQANKLINETIRKKLKLPPEKVPYSLDQFGNTSSASIPLTMVSRLAAPLEQPQKLLLSGFGVGFSWGNLLLDSTTIHCLPLIET